jgi:hypothetical protein
VTPFWLVINMGEFGRVPTKRHETEELAREEAARLAAKHPNISIFVVAAVSCYKATATVEHDDVAAETLRTAPVSAAYDYLGLPYATDCDQKRIYKNDQLIVAVATGLYDAGIESPLVKGAALRALGVDSPGPDNTVLVGWGERAGYVRAGDTRIVQAGS